MSSLVRLDFGTAVDRSARSVQHATEQVLGQLHLHRLAEEPYRRVPVDATGAFENLDRDVVARRFEHLSTAGLAVRRLDLDDLVVSDGLVDLGEHQRSADFRDRLVFFLHG